MSLHPDAVLLTDDAAARLAGKFLGYQVHGTIGILLRSLRRAQRSREEILKLLHALPKRSTLYLRRSILAEVISQVEQPTDKP